MDADLAEKAKARRHLRILLWCAAIGVGFPLVLLVLRHFRPTS